MGSPAALRSWYASRSRPGFGALDAAWIGQGCHQLLELLAQVLGSQNHSDTRRTGDGRGWFRTSDLSRVKRWSLRHGWASLRAPGMCADVRRCVRMCALTGTRTALVPNPGRRRPANLHVQETDCIAARRGTDKCGGLSCTVLLRHRHRDATPDPRAPQAAGRVLGLYLLLDEGHALALVLEAELAPAAVLALVLGPEWGRRRGCR